jgi:hypothetical protein
VSVTLTCCVKPVDVTLTGIVYVPVAVPDPPPCPPELPLVPPPELVQLDTPPAKIAANASIRKILRRLRNASGSSSNPHARGTARHNTGPPSFNADPLLVEISTSTFPCTPALNDSLLGLKLQIAFAGKVPQAALNVPFDPLGVITSVYLACCPRATVSLPGPVTATAKLKPVPANATVAGITTAAELTVSVPCAEPPALG